MRKHRKQSEDEHMDESWLIPYADLMTLMLALFIVLFASSQIDQKKLEQLSQAFSSSFSGNHLFESSTALPVYEIGSVTNREQLYMDKDGVSKENEVLQEEIELLELQEQMDRYIESKGLSAQLETVLNEVELMITIKEQALFDSGSAAVKDEGQILASALSEMMIQYPDYEIIIAGHTDNQPIATREYPSNWDLSADRALNFMKLLLQDENAYPQRFSAVGYGEFRPIASNEEMEGRALNRRVEINIMRKYNQTPITTESVN
ncbi:flagellar motor protein MotB [Longirhabdus pacifica]|uniref:flagellar motor protein MotB n=1 Tax=Longirhabdus pacifica TaxID=2305227 RepID=UPI0010086AC7|nr:flagellar motor protein MotB [Longirhabdus pacifica]